MNQEDNVILWQKTFNLDIHYKSYNATFDCDEYSSSCPECGGKDRLSVFGGNNGILAICWGEEHGRSGCGKKYYRKDYTNNPGETKTTPKKSPSPDLIKERQTFIQNSYDKLLKNKEYVPVFHYILKRGFAKEDVDAFKLGGTFERGKGFGLVLPIDKPETYYQIRWIQWDKNKSFAKYRNPKGQKVFPAIFSKESDIAIVFESLIDAMLIHVITGYTTLSAMGASLKDEALFPYNKVFLIPDQDDAGERAFGLKMVYPKISLPKPYKDIGDFIQDKGRDIVRIYLQGWIQTKTKRAKQQEPIEIKTIEKSKPKDTKEIPNCNLKDTEVVPTPKENTPLPLPAYKYITTEKEAVEGVNLIKTSNDKIALDTETTGLDFQRDKIRLVQLYTPTHGCFLFDIFAIGHLTFLKPLEDKAYIIHYAPFDVKFLRKGGITLSNYIDTKVMGAFICPLPNPKESKRNNLEKVPPAFANRDLSLKGLLKGYLGIDIPKDPTIRQGWEGELSQEKLDYASRDVTYLHALYDVMQKKIEGYEKTKIFEQYTQALKAHIEMEWNGASIRKEDLSQAIEDLNPLELTIAFIEKYGIDNPNSTKQLSDYVAEVFPKVKLEKTPSGKQYKLDIKNLEKVLDKGEFFTDLCDYKRQATAYREHIKLQEAISPVTGRVHPAFMILGASSGRTLSKNPNFQGQNIKVKAFVGYPDGSSMCITTADYSQQELRVFSLMTRNQDILDLLERGEDGYRAIASIATGKPPQEISKEERKPYKTATLALLYGQGVKLLSEQLGQSLKETKKLYKEIKDLLNVQSLQKKLYDMQQDKGRFFTFFGEGVRDIYDEWRTLREYQLINYCIQGTASNIGIVALNKLKEVLPKGANIIGYIHDEFLIEHDKNQTKEVQNLTTQSMENAFLECFPTGEKQRNYLVEVKTGNKWMK